MSSSDNQQMPLNAYGALWGPPLIATFVAAIVYGISVLQTFYYFSHHGKRDRIGWLILVAVIFVLDSIAMGLFMYCAYYYSILSWGMPEMLQPDVKEFPVEYILTTILALIVQCFYINTVRALHAPSVITVLLFITALVAFVTGLILPAVQLKLHFIQTIVVAPLNHIAFNIARGTALTVDLGIVGVLCWLFAIRKTGVRRANNVLDALIMFSVQRGVLQAIVQTGEVLAYAIKPDGIYFLPFHVIVSRIYCNSLLATLNSRDYILSKGQSQQERARKGRIDGANSDVEVGRVRIVRREEHLEEQQLEREAITERRKQEEDHLASPPGLPAPTANTTNASAGRWASTVTGSRQILSSFLEPPFLYTDESFALASRGVHTQTRHSNTISMIRSVSGSEMPASRSGTHMSTGSSGFADSERSERGLEKAESVSSISIGPSIPSTSTSSPVTPESKYRNAVHGYNLTSL